ncbi:MAG: GAF domain-containing protein, partial [Cyanobacteria bacterium P01_A01_bin.40]
LFELSEEQLLGKSDRDVFPAEIADLVIANDLEVLSTKSVIQFEEQVTLPDGSLHTYISIKAPLIDENGEIYAICGISTDISEQKQIEADLRAGVSRERTLLKVVEKIHQSLDLPEIFSTITEDLRDVLKCDRIALYQFDSDWNGKFIAESRVKGLTSLVSHQLFQNGWNDTCLRTTKGGRYKNQETFALCDIAAAGFSACHLQIYEQLGVKAYCIAPVFQGDQLWGLLAAYQNNLPRQWKEGEIRLLTQTGIQLGISIAQVDLFTQIKAKKAIETANQAKDAFISRMSHELRTPLNCILGFSNILKKQLIANPEQLYAIDIINQSGQHLLDLINDVLHFSKISAHKLELETSEFNLIQFLNQVANIFRLKADEKGLTFNVEVSPSVPLAVNLDQVKLRQILLNLLSNAFKFTDAGSVTFKVTLIKDLLENEAENSQQEIKSQP